MINAVTVSIIILAYNNLEYTQGCLRSILEKTEHPSYEIIIVDNASTDETPVYLEKLANEHTNVRLIFNKVNEGFPRGNNIGAMAAQGEYLVFLNNDVVVTKGWISGLLSHLEDPSVGMVGPVTNASGNASRIPVNYQSLDGLEGFAQAYTSSHAGQAFIIDMLPFQCVVIRRQVFEEIGLLDEQFGMGMFEDDDYAIRLKQGGYKILCAEDVYIHHWGSASFSRVDSGKYWKLFVENLNKFEAKWNVKWLPSMPRAEFIAEKFRQNLDATIWFSAHIVKYSELEIRHMRLAEEHRELWATQEKTVADLNAKHQEAYSLKLTLDGIYQSNGWKFLQQLLRIRRFFVPEKSRRERFLKLVIGLARDLKKEKLTALFTEMKTLFKRQPPRLKLTSELIKYQAPLFVDEKNLTLIQSYLPKVSVILPVYNHADMLEMAVKGVLISTYPSLELIILDDGSTDEIEPVLERLVKNPRVHVFRQPNQKLSRALTHAHKLCQGEFISWTSADNLMTPNAIEMLVKALINHPEAVLTYADVGLIDDQGKILTDGEAYRPQNVDPDQKGTLRLYQDSRPLGYEADNYINACFMYRREAAMALEGHYSDDLWGLEDYDFWLRLQKMGEFYHIRNQQPLYYYRVHARTMSHEIMSKQAEKDAHLKRTQSFIEYEGRRRSFCQQRWEIILDESLLSDESTRLAGIAAEIPVDCHHGGLGWAPDRKCLRFVSATAQIEDLISVRVLPAKWQLTWKSYWSDEKKTLDINKGIDIHPLALKARQHRKNIWEFPQAGHRPVVGCHFGLANYRFDRAATRQMILKNSQYFFVFVDRPGDEDLPLGSILLEGLENAIYLGSRPFGEIYQLYACFDACWLPPFLDEPDEEIYRQSLALTFAIGRPLIVPYGFKYSAAPYQFYYRPPSESLGFSLSFNRSSMDVEILNRYLDLWSVKSSLNKVLLLSNAVLQDRAVARPDFGIHPPTDVDPTFWLPKIADEITPIKCALVVNTLDKGGVEEVVAQLARGLQDYGVESFVLCVNSGGETADRLKKDGVRVLVANGQSSEIRDLLLKERPTIVNSHYATLECLEVINALGLPIVETVHNTYVWLDAAGWQTERRRSLYFSSLIAVSNLVGRYYARWNPIITPEMISIIPNGIAAPNSFIDQKEARRQLGIPEEKVLFLNLASYDGRKNQLGLLTAFDRAARDYPEAVLICAGNVLNPEYYENVKKYRESLGTNKQIELYEHRQDTGLLFSAADVFILDSFFEGWSIAATEALMAGVPLIHTECGSALELVGLEGERGIVVPNPAGDPIDLIWERILPLFERTEHLNTQSLSQVITKMIYEHAQWREKRKAIRDHAIKNFDAHHMVRVYSQLLKEKAGRKVTLDIDRNQDINSELSYWDRELSLEGKYPQAIIGRSDPDKMISEYPVYISRFIEELTIKNSRIPRVLDVGSGPLSMFAYGAVQGLIELVAVDPLADRYKLLLQKYGFKLGYDLIQCSGEDLRTIYSPETFDLAWIYNALDHSEDPEYVLREMVDVLKPGGYLIFQGWSREGSANNWQGMHHHDIYLEPGGMLMCATKETSRSGYLYTRCINRDLPLELVETSTPTKKIRQWIMMVWKKTS